MQYASSGVGTFLHLAGELFKITAGVDILHIPFRGAGPALIDVVGGHTKVAFGSVTSSIGHIRAGKLRPLGVGSMTRQPDLAGRADRDRGRRAGLRGGQLDRHRGDRPARPSRSSQRLHKEIAEILDSPEVQKLFAAEGADIVQMSTAQFGAYMRERDREMGPRRQAGRHQGAVAARLNFYLTDR